MCNSFSRIHIRIHITTNTHTNEYVYFSQKFQRTKYDVSQKPLIQKMHTEPEILSMQNSSTAELRTSLLFQCTIYSRLANWQCNNHLLQLFVVIALKTRYPFLLAYTQANLRHEEADKLLPPFRPPTAAILATALFTHCCCRLKPSSAPSAPTSQPPACPLCHPYSSRSHSFGWLASPLCRPHCRFSRPNC